MTFYMKFDVARLILKTRKHGWRFYRWGSGAVRRGAGFWLHILPMTVRSLKCGVDSNELVWHCVTRSPKSKSKPTESHLQSFPAGVPYSDGCYDWRIIFGKTNLNSSIISFCKKFGGKHTDWVAPLTMKLFWRRASVVTISNRVSLNSFFLKLAESDLHCCLVSVFVLLTIVHISSSRWNPRFVLNSASSIVSTM